MSDPGIGGLVALPAALGLLGFIEPCSIGTTLLFIKYLESRPRRAQVAETIAFAAVRALFIGTLGMLAVIMGSAFSGVQKTAWIVLGALYLLLGIVLLSGRGGALMITIGPRIGRLSGARGVLSLGVLFGLNIPACAAPLLAALLAGAAAGGALGTTLVAGFVSLAVFGIALSAPLVAAMLLAPVREALVALARWATQMQRLTGVVMIVLGMWSIRFGLVVDVGFG